MPAVFKLGSADQRGQRRAPRGSATGFRNVVIVCTVFNNLRPTCFQICTHKSVCQLFGWSCPLSTEYPLLSNKAVNILLPFATTYSCETSFSALTNIWTRSTDPDLSLKMTCVYVYPTYWQSAQSEASTSITLTLLAFHCNNWWCWFVCKKQCAQEFEYFAVNFTVTSVRVRQLCLRRIGVRSQKSLKTAVLCRCYNWRWLSVT